MILIAVASFAAWALVLLMWLATRALFTDIRQESAIPAVTAELDKLHLSLSTIKTITTILPLLGLLGTVLGMLQTFAAIQSHGAGRPELFASGIRQALLTTQAGLCTALPLLFSHHVLSSRLRTITSRIRLIIHVAKTPEKSPPKPECP